MAGFAGGISYYYYLGFLGTLVETPVETPVGTPVETPVETLCGHS